MPKVSDAHLEARRRQILDAAARCFARDGFHRTSMLDVVRECGISAGLVYRYFASKDDVIAAIATEWHDRRQEMIDPGDDAAPEDAAPGRVGLDDAAAAYLDLLRSVGDPESRQDLRLGVQVWAETVRSDRLRAVARRGVDRPRGVLVDAVRRAQASGDVTPDVDPDALVRIMIAIYQGIRLQTLWDETVDHEAVASTTEAMIAALSAPLTPR
jgi:AcrR family transcriptional regulator